VNGVLEPTHRYIITFNKPDLPESIKITSWHFELLEAYLPKPMRCLACQRVGHTKKHCRRPETTCSQCAEDRHVSRQCSIQPPRCVNCGGEHNAMSNKCPHYLYKSEVLATMTVNKYPTMKLQILSKTDTTKKANRIVLLSGGTPNQLRTTE